MNPYRDNFGFLWEKKRLQSEGYFSKLRHDFKISNGENARNWVQNLIIKFHDDPIVNESEIVIFLKYVWWSAGKREGFERKREKNENEGKRRHRQKLT